MIIILLGAPGAGKGTQCKNIVAKYGLLHLSSGDILRRHRAQGTQLGKKAQSYMDSGALVPDQLIIDMMIGEIKNAPAAGCILDGFPRTVKQAVELDKALAGNGQKIDVVLNLVIDDHVVAGRMTGRRSCPKCGAVYHVENLKPKTPGICDRDGEKLVQRPDDAPDVVANRLRTYHQQTEPLVEYYQQKGLVFDVNADGDPDHIKTLIFDKLDGLAKDMKRVSAKRSTK